MDKQAAIDALEREYQHQLEAGPQWLGIGVNTGWISIVRALFYRIDNELTVFERRRIKWAQIKQKWGGLRAYYNLDRKFSRLHLDIVSPMEHIHLVEGVEEPLAWKLDRLIEDAAAEASRTCEICGQAGARVESDGCVMVACASHRNCGSWRTFRGGGLMS